MEIFIGWLFFSIIAGVIASRKGRSGEAFFTLSLFLSPVVGIIAALIAKPNIAKIEQSAIESGLNKKCPFCAEIIKQEARVCRYCGRELESTAEPDASATKRYISPTIVFGLFLLLVIALFYFR